MHDDETFAATRTADLIEGRDYTLRPSVTLPAGEWVFTREFLLSRKTCCGSQCANCPFDDAKRQSNHSANHSADQAFRRPIVSMVPSWTETLIAADLLVVARTRFCVHPKPLTQSLKSIGGTKNLAADAVETLARISGAAPGLKPLVILDREENPKEFYDFFSEHDCEVIVTHVTDLKSLAEGLGAIAEALEPGAQGDRAGAQVLRSYAARVGVIGAKRVAPVDRGSWIIESREPREAFLASVTSRANPVFYFIWRNPWMIVSKGTWIGEVLRTKLQVDLEGRFGSENSGSSKTYPTIEASEIPPGSVLLFSSEPYSFRREWPALLELPFVKFAKSAAIVDGEKFSWFGLRAIRFLEDSKF